MHALRACRGDLYNINWKLNTSMTVPNWKDTPDKKIKNTGVNHI